MFITLVSLTLLGIFLCGVSVGVINATNKTYTELKDKLRIPENYSQLIEAFDTNHFVVDESLILELDYNILAFLEDIKISPLKYECIIDTNTSMRWVNKINDIEVSFERVTSYSENYRAIGITRFSDEESFARQNLTNLEKDLLGMQFNAWMKIYLEYRMSLKDMPIGLHTEGVKQDVSKETLKHFK